MQLPADRLDVFAGGLTAVFGVLRQARPGFRRIAEVRQIESHGQILLWNEVSVEPGSLTFPLRRAPSVKVENMKAADGASPAAGGYAAMLMPSHKQTPFSTARICSGESIPRRLISLTVGTVTIPCASNAPGRRNLGDAVTSNRDCRRLV